jgi:hypothetical protein
VKRRVASSFSLLLVLCALAHPVDYRELEARMKGGDDQAVRALRAIKPDEILDPELQSRIDDVLRGDRSKLKAVRESISLKAELQDAAVKPAQAPKELSKAVEEIKRSPLYRDAGVQDSSNWIMRALNRLASYFNTPELSSPRTPRMAPIGPWLLCLMWGLLALGVLWFAYFAIRHFTWAARLKRKSSAVLDEDEPERTLDEWLELAAQLEAEGRYREAVRCLYLACLLKFDEHRVARFDRGQTNWEHLTRIAASPSRPGGLDFELPTKAFDRIWYGQRLRGIEDVADFRAWYSDVKAALERRAA